MHLNRQVQGSCLVYLDPRALGGGINRRGGDLLIREGLECCSRKLGFHPEGKREPPTGFKQGN